MTEIHRSIPLREKSIIQYCTQTASNGESVSVLQSHHVIMMTSSNGNIFRVTGPLCGEFTGPGEFPTQRPVTRSFDVIFDLRLNKRLSKHWWGWWFETPSWPLWRQCNDTKIKWFYSDPMLQLPSNIEGNNGLSVARERTMGRLSGTTCPEHNAWLFRAAWWRHQMESFSALLALCEESHRSPVDSPHKGQWRGTLMFSLICAWTNSWAKIETPVIWDETALIMTSL